MTRTLLCGWFSVDGGEATAGDLLAMEEVRDVLGDARHTVDVATNAGLLGGVDWRRVDPDAYGHLVFVCGPLHGERVEALIDRFPKARKLAVNVSVVDRGLAARFDVVLARDDPDRPEATRPDLALARRPDPVPVVGVVRSHAQPEYAGALPDRAHEVLRLVLASRPCATVDFDTRVHPAADPFEAHGRDPAAIAALAGRMDAVVTTRLHGLVLSLAQGTPVVAVDPVAGGAKVAAQARVLDWPCVFVADDLHPEHVAEGLEWCLGPAGRARAAACRQQAQPPLQALRNDVLAAATRAPR